MAKYDFDTLVDRTHLHSSKWNMMLAANPRVPAGISPLSVADMDMPTAPEIVAGLKQYLDEAVLGYTVAPESYYQAIVDWMARRHDWDIQAEWIVESNGVVPAIFNAVRAFSDEGDGVIVQTPAYYPFYMAIEANGRQVKRNPLLLEDDRYVINFDELEQLAADPKNKILMFCSPHNPTGRVWTPGELERVAAIVLEHDLILISDEIHFDLIMPGYRHTVMSTISAAIAARTVVCTAPSKTFNLAGLQNSNIIIADPQLREHFIDTRVSTGFHRLPALGYRACEVAYTQCESWLDELLQLVWNNHQLVRRFIRTHIPEITAFKLEGTYLQWLDFRGLGKTPEELQRIHEQQAFLYFDEGGMFGPEGAGFERINLGAPRHVIEAAMERLAVAYPRT